MDTPQEQYLMLEDWVQKLGISMNTGRRWVKEGNAPPPIRISPKCIRWKKSVIDAWIDSRQASK